MHLQPWHAPGGSTEYTVGFGGTGDLRLLVLPAWFDESNKLRHLTVETMRALARSGISSVLPDLPGCNESPAALGTQNIDSWRSAAAEAARQLSCTHVLAIRAGANIAPDLPGWAYAPLAGKSALRSLLRARTIAAREAGREEKTADLIAAGKVQGLELAGYRLGASMVEQLSTLEVTAALRQITAADVGGPGLWLRSEPDHNPAQAEALARIVTAGMTA